MTPWTIASAQKLAAACPRLLGLPGLASIDPLQAWAVWDRLCQLGPRPRVLELGHGHWSVALAVMTETLGGEFCSIGTSQRETHVLRDQLDQVGTGNNVSASAVPLAGVEFDGREGLFPDLSMLAGCDPFDLVWISAGHLFPDAEDLAHTLPAVSGWLSNRGFDVVIQGASRQAQAQALEIWQAVAEGGLAITPDACQGTGLLVSGRSGTHDPGASAVSSANALNIAIPATITRPELTLPEQEGREVAQRYQKASVILEYGSGGSTVLAAELPGKKIFSVESDPKWLCRLNTYLHAVPHPSLPVTYYADIGATKEWGRPVAREGRDNYPDYSAGIWQQSFFEQPDLVLVDGRFRPACFLVCAALTRAPLTLLFDDYVDRPHYHYVEAVARPVSLVGRMAVFELVPGDFKDAHRDLLAKALYEPE